MQIDDFQERKRQERLEKEVVAKSNLVASGFLTGAFAMGLIAVWLGPSIRSEGGMGMIVATALFGGAICAHVYGAAELRERKKRLRP